MQLTDPIADLLSRIKNAIKENKGSVDIPHSGIKEEIIKALSAEGLLNKTEILQRGSRRMLRVGLKYDEKNKSIISHLERVSKPGRRYYVNAREVPSVLGGFGVAIISTSRGILTDAAARRQKLGGELLLKVW
ncbi:MAG: 30S ribosomal protein S8 [Candidatus Margulisiibacteriota bacterium]